MQNIHTRHARSAFTLIELLVVVAIIVALLAILLPSMQRAIASGERAVCNSNIHQQYLAMLNYAADNFSKFPQHDTEWPMYVKNTGFATNMWEALDGDYITDGEVTICPTMRGTMAGWERFQDKFGYAGTYGAWSSGVANINVSYAWYTNMPNTNTFVWEPGETPFPIGVTTATANSVMISHTQIYMPTGFAGVRFFYDTSHNGEGYIHRPPPSGKFIATDVPVGYGDGHVENHFGRDEIKLRATKTSGSQYEIHY